MVIGHLYPGIWNAIYTIFSFPSFDLLHIAFGWAFLPSDACYRLKKKMRGYSEVETEYSVDSPKLRIA